MKRKMRTIGTMVGLAMLLCTGCGTKSPQTQSSSAESVTESAYEEIQTEIESLSSLECISESETEEVITTTETEVVESEPQESASETTQAALPEPVPQESAVPVWTEPVETAGPETVVPLTKEEVEAALQEMGYSMVIVNELEDHTFAAAVYENTILSYVIRIDPVTGIGEVGNAFEEPLGTIDLRNRAVLSGSPLPVPEVEFVPAPATLSEPLSEEYVLEKLKEYYTFSENPGVGEYYDYPGVEEDTFTYYDWMMGVSGVGHTITVYRYSGQAVVRDEHGRYERDFMLQLP